MTKKRGSIGEGVSQADSQDASQSTAQANDVITLNLNDDPIDLTEALVNIPSVSRDEKTIADAVEAALDVQVVQKNPAVQLIREGNTVLARTNRGLATRVILAGHLDTVPIANNLPCRRGKGEDGSASLIGLGTVDMKSGDAVLMHLFAELADSPQLVGDMTLVMYECEEIASEFNGLTTIARELPEWLHGDLAILAEPSGGQIEAGCQGTLRLIVAAGGIRAHSARGWLGDNAIHRLAPVLNAVSSYKPRSVDIDGCVYREGLQVVSISGGVANNVVPDTATVSINFRYAPDRTQENALDEVLRVLGLEARSPDEPVMTGLKGTGVPNSNLSWELKDMAPGAKPGLSHPAAAALLRAAHGKFRAKYGWTDVSRFAALGIPAVNFGPGDPGLAHKPEEYCPVSQITEVATVLRSYLLGPDSVGT